MGRWTGSWLSGPGAVTGGSVAQPYPGARLGRPASGPGALAPVSARLGAIAIDAVASWLVAALFVRGPVTGAWSTVVFVAEIVLFTVAAGQTAGMRLMGLRVERVAGGRQAPQWLLLRTVLLCLVVPALIWDADGRGTHDRAAGTVVARV